MGQVEEDINRMNLKVNTIGRRVEEYDEKQSDRFNRMEDRLTEMEEVAKKTRRNEEKTMKLRKLQQEMMTKEPTKDDLQTTGRNGTKDQQHSEEVEDTDCNLKLIQVILG